MGFFVVGFNPAFRPWLPNLNQKKSETTNIKVNNVGNLAWLSVEKY